jgi:phosphopantetheinyl transferase (holo-ACP synthase)
MIGFDISDLNDPLLRRGMRTGYVRKAFSSAEIRAIEGAGNHSMIPWHFWTVKEAVYKAACRLSSIRELAPKKIQILDVETLFDDPCVDTNPMETQLLQLSNTSKQVFSASYENFSFRVYLAFCADYVAATAVEFSVISRLSQASLEVVENIPADGLRSRISAKLAAVMSSEKFFISEPGVDEIPMVMQGQETSLWQYSSSNHGTKAGFVLWRCPNNLFP